MIDTAEWVTRLKSTCPSFGGRIYDAGELDNYLEAQKTLPVAFVALDSESASENIVVGRVRQSVYPNIGIYILLPNNGTSATEGQAGLKQLRGEIRTSLLGWWPTATFQPVMLGTENKQESVQVRGIIAWHDTYTTEYIEETM